MTHREPTFSLLNEVNRLVNRRTRYVPDIQLHGLNEYWVAADKMGDRGDCEDYALAKRNLLLAEGVDPKALRIAVCTDETGGWHAVLTVDAHGDHGLTTFVLDNRFLDLWSYKALVKKGYTFYVRQIVGEKRWELINPLPPGVRL